MASKNRDLIILIFIVIGFLLVFKYKPQTQATFRTTGSQQDCIGTMNNYKSGHGRVCTSMTDTNCDYACVGPCIKVTSALVSCMNTCGSSLTMDYNYVLHFHEIWTCSYEYSNWDIGKCEMDCLYGSVPPSCTQTCSCASSTPIGGTCQDSCFGTCEGTMSSGCSILGDTAPCNVITRAELGTIINNWISGSVTRIQLGTAIQAWVNG